MMVALVKRRDDPPVLPALIAGNSKMRHVNKCRPFLSPIVPVTKICQAIPSQVENVLNRSSPFCSTASLGIHCYSVICRKFDSLLG